jgi:hypothetical protein
VYLNKEAAMTCRAADPAISQKKMATEAVRWLQQRIEADELLDGIRETESPEATQPAPAPEAAKERVGSPSRARKGTVRPRPLGDPA